MRYIKRYESEFSTVPKVGDYVGFLKYLSQLNIKLLKYIIDLQTVENNL